MESLIKLIVLAIYFIGFGILFYTFGGWASLALYFLFLLLSLL